MRKKVSHTLFFLSFFQRFAQPGYLHRHLVNLHSKLTLEPMLEAEGIALPPRTPNTNPLNKKPGPRSKTSPAAVKTTSPFREPACKLCQLAFKSEVHAKRHYLHHFRKVFQVIWEGAELIIYRVPYFSLLQTRIRRGFICFLGPPRSGSFYHQAKIVRRTLLPTVL
jgi:hypothetical protein